MTSNIEAIRAAEARIPELQSELERIRTEAMADDVITPDEQRQIDAVEGKIGDLERLLTEKRRIWEENKAAYEQLRASIDANLTTAAQCEYEFLAEDTQAIADLQARMEEAAAAEDYQLALEHGRALEAAVADFLVKLEELELKRAEYETTLSTLQPRLDQYSQSTPELAYVDDLMSTRVTLQTEMEAAAEFGDFDNALRLQQQLSDKLDEIDAAIAAKREEYETQRAELDTRLADISSHSYVDIASERDALASSTNAIDTAAGAEDWQTALDLTGQALVDCDSYQALADEQEVTKTTIEERMATVRSELANHSDSTSSVKRGADANVAKVDRALGGGGSLNEALALTDTLMHQIEELEAMKAVMDRLDAADPDDLDDVSRAIVEEMTAAGTLDTLPTETRTTLVDNLMSGTPTEDEHAAIQEIFSIPHVDRQFEEFDSQTRQSIVDAYMSDPEVQELAENWHEMEPADRMAAVNKLIQVPCGEDGWDVGLPGTITPFDEPFGEDGGLYGAYDHGGDEMTFNVNDDAHGDFGEVLDTITHEMGHRYQMQLIERLDPSHPDALSPGDPEYEQARWLQQDDNYLNRFSDPDDDDDPFDRIYFTSPSETHSRVMGREVKEGLREGFDIPEDEDDDGGGHHHDHAH